MLTDDEWDAVWDEAIERDCVTDREWEPEARAAVEADTRARWLTIKAAWDAIRSRRPCTRCRMKPPMKLRALPLLLLAGAAQASVMTYTVSGVYNNLATVPAELRGQPFTVTEMFNTSKCGQGLQPDTGYQLRCGNMQFDYIFPHPGAPILVDMRIDRTIPGYDYGYLWLHGLEWAPERHEWVPNAQPPKFPPMGADLVWWVGIAGHLFDPGGTLSLVNHSAGTIEATETENPEPATWWLMAGPLGVLAWRRWRA